jgi:hypothetical protein
LACLTLKYVLAQCFTNEMRCFWFNESEMEHLSYLWFVLKSLFARR